jgi:AcrR family transcriptional regulator
LLRTARENLKQGGTLDELGLNELARQTGMAKSNVYRYFESREALLLDLLWEEWTSWFLGIQKQINSRKIPRQDPEMLIRRIVKDIAGQRLLCLLTAALPTVLEANLSEQKVREFKKSSLDFFWQAAAYFESIAPQLSKESYARMLHDGACLIAGLYPHAHPAKVVQKVLKSSELGFFRRNFAKDLERMLLAITLADKRE